MEPIRILLVEDSVIDADLVRSNLDRGVLRTSLTRVETRTQFLDALAGRTWDLILSDFALPDFDGLSALELAQRHAPDIPFIFVSGVLGEEFAIDTLTRGATDYVLKKNLARLPAAIDRALALGRERAERRRAQEALNEAKEAAEAANRAKDHFLAVLSHELRTPLAPILATVQLWDAEQSVPAHMAEGLEVIRRNAELEARLIDDLLDITRVMRGKMDLNMERVNLHTLLERVEEICRSDVDGKDHRLTLRHDGSRTDVDGDAARLHQIFWNLLKNAVKFTPDGGNLMVRTFDAADGQIGVEVSDSGIGIPADVLPRIFDAFEQGDRSLSRQFGGLGLGLSIAKALVERHGGVLQARSDGPGHGSVFTATLPAAAPSEIEQVEETKPPSVNGDSMQLEILFVEDHADTALVMQKQLELLGHKVEIARTVKDAVEQVKSGRFDMLISDIGLPDGSGVEIVKHAGTSDMMAIAITGFGMEQDIRRCKEAGFHDHLTKPIDFGRLESAINGLANQRALKR